MQQDTHKTKIQLLDELRELRQRNTELEAIVSNLKETDKTLQESEKRFKAIANYSFDWESWVGTDGKLMWVNPAVEKFTGYSAEEYLNLPDRFNQIIWDGDRDRIFSHVKNGVQKHQSDNDVEFQIRRKDGSLKWVSASYQPMYTETGECLGLRSSIRDISKRKLAEQVLQESEERFKAVAASSPDAILISDQNGAIIFWNNAAVEMFGYEEKGIVGKSYTMLLPERLRDQDQKAGQRFLETGMLPNNKKPLETIALRKDGSEFPIEITFSSWKVKDQYCFSFIMRDITERKHHEEALRESEERFRTIAEASPAAIITADSNGKILFWNKAAEAIYGYKAKEIVGESIELLRPEGKRLVDRKNRENFMKTGHSLYIGKTVEGQARKKDGTEFLSETSTSYWKIGGEIIFCGIVRDISERKRTEKTLQQEKYFSDTVINSLPGIFYLLDEQGHIIRWNKQIERVTGYSAIKLQNLNALAIIHEDDRALITSKIKEVFTNGKAEVEAKLLGRHGKVSHYFFTGRRMAIEGQSYLAGVGIDIIERKRLERKLQKSHDELEKKVKQRTGELGKTNKELQAAKDYLKKFAGKLLAIREEERRNISRALHDELGSMSVSVGSKISIAKEELKDNNAKAALRNLKQGEIVLRKAVADIRKLAVDLRPPSLENMGLSAALRDYIETIKKHSKIKITFQNDLGNKKIIGATAIAIYRVAQEAVTNISKHSQAKKVRVRLYADNKNIKLNVTDDGVGFDVDKTTSYSKRGRFKMGIEGMKERIESLGGVLVIKSILRKGTLIKASLPKE